MNSRVYLPDIRVVFEAALRLAWVLGPSPPCQFLSCRLQSSESFLDSPSLFLGDEGLSITGGES